MTLDIFSQRKGDILALHEKTQKDLDESLEILKEWIIKEQHLPTSLLEETRFLEIALIRNKYSIEKTKSKIENYCTLKRRYSYIMEDYVGLIEATKETQFQHPIELLEDGMERIFIYTVLDEKKYNFERDVAVIMLQRELLSRFDYNNGEIFVMDMSDISLNVIKQYRVNLVAHTMALILNGHSARIKQIHIINNWASIFITFFKNIFPAKLNERFYAHQTKDTLKDFISLKYLPSEYGGDQKSLADIRADWDKIFKENLDLLKSSYNTMSREELRISTINPIEMQGTFKKLVVD